MAYVLAVTTPIYLQIAVGFVALRLRWMAPADTRVLAQRHGHERLCAAALLAATVTSFVSISLLIALLPPAWLPAH